jgi:two-component system, NtrC family, sensor kinase
MRSFGRPRVLLCDHEPATRAACERALTDAGYEATSVERGAEAIRAVARDPFDVAILDVGRADEDGFAALAEIRRRDPDLPCVVTAGDAVVELAMRSLREGASDFVPKPIETDALVRSVDRAIATTHLQVDSILLAATQSIFASLDADEVRARCLRAIVGLLGAAQAAIVLGDDDPGRAFRLAEGASAVDEAPPPPAPPGLWRRLVEARDPLLLARDVPGDDVLIDALAPGASSVITQRLSIADRVAGVLVAARGAGARGFGERDLRRATLLAGHAVLAIENARLHAETEAQARELEQAIDRIVVSERIASVARLATSLGHEISNPTCAVMAYLELARDAVVTGRRQDAEDALGRAVVGARLVLDVCAALRPLASQSADRDQAVDVRTIAEGVVLLLAAELRSRARPVLDLPDKLPVWRGDPARLGQVLLNLVLNAAAALPPGRPDANEVRIRARAEGDLLSIEVADTGPGVDPAIADRLFEQSVTTKREPGRGMGLAICRWIVEEAGGTIRHRPAEPHGAVFEIRLPLAVRPRGG